jgi:kynureninase
METSAQDYALKMDREDPLKHFRDQFHFPQLVEGKPCLYFTGNSLGLQPKSAGEALQIELDNWAKYGVEGHFHGDHPWFHYHEFFTENTAKLVGALPHEVVVMNNLTVNLHLLFASFYRPSGKRTKILMEGGAFPSDMYMVESQINFHGGDYERDAIEMKPREGEHHLRTEDILRTIEDNRKELALVFFSGVQYYTGQAFDMKAITQKAHEYDILCGFDLAHAAGNLKMDLHEWGVDFATWCSYKYLNSGPGSVSGVYVHERHGLDPQTPRLAGWWGHAADERFKMKKGFIPEPGAAGWQLSNAPVFSMAIHRKSLEMFAEAGMEALSKKGAELNRFLEDRVMNAARENSKLSFEIITPEERGCQLSILTGENGKELFDFLTENHVVADWREPNVIRMAPVPMYNSFMDVYQFGEILKNF